MSERSLSADEAHLLRAIASGVRLMDHRAIEGRKTFMLHPVEGEPSLVDAALVHALADAGLISSNKKFPAATYWLTDAGREAL